MNKEQLEKMFDEKYWNELNDRWNLDWLRNELKQFIFSTIIPEVLKSITLVKREETNHIDLAFNNYWKYIKQQAKELYWIDL